MPFGEAIRFLPLDEEPLGRILVAGERPRLSRESDIQPAMLKARLEPEGRVAAVAKELPILLEHPGSAPEREDRCGIILKQIR